MRVGCLYRTHHAYQGDAEHTHSSDEHPPIYRYPQHARTAFLIDLGAWPLDDCTLRWSSAEVRCTQKMRLPLTASAIFTSAFQGLEQMVPALGIFSGSHT
jgi:hypothetical protein